MEKSLYWKKISFSRYRKNQKCRDLHGKCCCYSIRSAAHALLHLYFYFYFFNPRRFFHIPFSEIDSHAAFNNMFCKSSKFFITSAICLWPPSDVFFLWVSSYRWRISRFYKSGEPESGLGGGADNKFVAVKVIYCLSFSFFTAGSLYCWLLLNTLMVSGPFGKTFIIRRAVGQLFHFTRCPFASLWWQGLGERPRGISTSQQLRRSWWRSKSLKDSS